MTFCSVRSISVPIFKKIKDGKGFCLGDLLWNDPTGKCRLDPGNWRLDPVAWQLFGCNPGDPMLMKWPLLVTLLHTLQTGLQPLQYRIFSPLQQHHSQSLAI